jgi:putative transposase
VRQKCLVIAYAVHESGRREVIGLDVGEAETEAFWRDFLRSLRARGLSGVRLCVSDCHEGLRAAIGQVLGCPWQRCTVHYAEARVMPRRARTRCGAAGRARVRSA